MHQSCLIVEDEPSHLLLMRECIESFGFSVESAGSVEQATWICRKRSFGMVVVDVSLPDGTGFEVQRLLSEWTTPPALLFVTSDDLAEDAVRAMRAGADDYIVKRPHYLDELKDAVERLLATPVSDREKFEQAERASLLAALEKNRWNVLATARSLGISRGKLRSRMAKYDL